MAGVNINSLLNSSDLLIKSAKQGKNETGIIKGAEIKLLSTLRNCLVKSAKTKYYCDLFQDAKGNVKKVWNAVNEVFSRNSTSESGQCIIPDGSQHTSYT